MEYAEKINFSARIPTKVWAVVSFGTAILVWYLLSIDAKTSRSFPFLNQVIPSIQTMIQRGALEEDIASRLLTMV